jgi:hypothetical protein
MINKPKLIKVHQPRKAVRVSVDIMSDSPLKIIMV